ncbi:MAG: Gfo/Idh/MocA family protein, partial [Burkholderiaceae bacterium]
MRICILGAGFIGTFYLEALQANRSSDRVTVVYSRTMESAQNFADKHGVAHATDNLQQAVEHPEVDAVVIGLPNHLHEQAVMAAIKAGKPVLCTKPLGRNADEAYRMLKAA